MKIGLLLPNQTEVDFEMLVELPHRQCDLLHRSVGQRVSHVRWQAGEQFAQRCVEKSIEPECPSTPHRPADHQGSDHR